MAIALACWWRLRRVRPGALAALAAGGLVGYLLTGGWWAWRMWTAFGNPVFPLFNDLFQSPFAPLASLHDPNFLPGLDRDRQLSLALAARRRAVGAEISVRDPRYAVR
jgi:hypothetical protein